MTLLGDALNQAVTSVLAEVLLALLALAAAYATLYIRRLAQRLEQQSQSDLGDAAIRRVSQLAEQVVLALEATSARAVRQAVADGRVDRQELERIGQQAVDEVLQSLNAASREALRQTVGDVQAYIRREVEARLEALKAQGIVPRLETLRQAAVASPK